MRKVLNTTASFAANTGIIASMRTLQANKADHRLTQAQRTLTRNASPPPSTHCRSLHEDASAARAIARPRRSPKSQVCYVGLLTKEQAEESCKKRTEFRLYHRLPSDAPGVHQLRSALTLTIVYRTSAGNYCHYPIRQNGYASDEVGYRVRVDYGDPASPEFTSIPQLIRYYTLFFHKNPDASCGVEMDVFPWWTAAQRRRGE
ncbi:Protein F42G4.6 [Aphelenchoides avenae]|nr:Protein F42G4.6 [Aphelenchus avenae]